MGAGVLLSFHPTLVRGERLGLRERIAAARTHGYQALECGPQEVAAALDGRTAEAFWAESGLRPALMGGVVQAGPFAPEAEFERALEGMTERARAVAAAGGWATGLVLPNRSSLPEGEARTLVTGRLRRIAERIAPAGLRLAVEFIGVRTLWPELPHPFLQRYEDTLAMLEATGRDNVGLLLDAYHWYAAGATAAAVAQTPAARIVYLHVNDAKPGPLEAIADADRLVPGEGVIDLVGWFGAVARTGYTGPVAPEVLGPRLRGLDTAEAARLCREGIVAAMTAAGVPVGRQG